MQVISANWPAAQGYIDAPTAIAAAREFNDAAVELMQIAPERFRAFATIPLQDPDAAVKELERCVREEGFVGTMIQGHSNLEYLDGQCLDSAGLSSEDLEKIYHKNSETIFHLDP